MPFSLIQLIRVESFVIRRRLSTVLPLQKRDRRYSIIVSHKCAIIDAGLRIPQISVCPGDIDQPWNEGVFTRNCASKDPQDRSNILLVSNLRSSTRKIISHFTIHFMGSSLLYRSVFWISRHGSTMFTRFPDWLNGRMRVDTSLVNNNPCEE